MMHTLTSIQRFLNVAHHMQPNFLKFCYFLIAFTILSCGNTNSSEAKIETNVPLAVDIERAETSSKKTILCFGDSITAGYGLDDINDAFPAILQSRIDSLGLEYVVVNSGVSGETTAGGRNRIKWVLNQEVDVFLLELGANDGLRGVPLSETRGNLQAIIDAVRDKKPNIPIVLAGMELPPNMGKEYTTEFRSIFADLAIDNGLAFIPFILKDVGGIASLNQSDGIHPTVEGHKMVAHTVWEVLGTIINR